MVKSFAHVKSNKSATIAAKFGTLYFMCCICNGKKSLIEWPESYVESFGSLFDELMSWSLLSAFICFQFQVEIYT